jgi:hypothetical protein
VISGVVGGHLTGVACGAVAVEVVVGTTDVVGFVVVAEVGVVPGAVVPGTVVTG